MAVITRWWWVSAAPMAQHGIYIGQQDEPPIAVDDSVYELLASIIPPPTLTYSSPLARAIKPAQALAQLKDGADIAQLDAFTEQHFGEWESKSFADVQAMIESNQSVSHAEIADLTPQGGESYSEVITRAGLAIDAIGYQVADNAPTAPVDILCVSHISVIRAAIGKALDLTPEQTLKINLQPLSLTILEHHEQLGWLVHTTGWTPWPMVR